MDSDSPTQPTDVTTWIASVSLRPLRPSSNFLFFFPVPFLAVFLFLTALEGADKTRPLFRPVGVSAADPIVPSAARGPLETGRPALRASSSGASEAGHDSLANELVEQA